MDISSTQTISFGVIVVANNFFAPASFYKQFFCPSYRCGFHYKLIYSLICARLHYRMCDQTTCGVVRSINLICKQTFNSFLGIPVRSFLRIFLWGRGAFF